ncbi:Nanos protein [Fasciolopsis buskii]|uniref:Nanos protein n=1 Tax=Fasciolopsis buskii TaxID=27845 RepID=A0A8E0S5F9_9TREM|nr:Nanos protein [Fasciolopsis buski]
MQSQSVTLESLWQATPSRHIAVPDFPIGVWPETWSPWTTPSSSSSALSSPPLSDHGPELEIEPVSPLHQSFLRMGVHEAGSLGPKQLAQLSAQSAAKSLKYKSDHCPFFGHLDASDRNTNKGQYVAPNNRWTAFETELEAWEKRLSQGKNVPAIPRSQLAGFGEFLRRLRTTVRRKSEEGLELCAFCRNNGEPFEVYITHKVRDTSGRVTCPVLRLLSCPLCKSTGDSAHTIKYCPYRASHH